MPVTYNSPIIQFQLVINGINAALAGKYNPIIAPTMSVAIGTAAGNVNSVVYVPAGTVTNGTPYTFNLITGLQTDGVTAASMARVLAYAFVNLSTVSGQDMTVGAGTHPVLANSFPLQSNLNGTGSMQFAIFGDGGLPVVSSSTDTLQITVAAGTAVPFSYVIWGCTS